MTLATVFVCGATGSQGGGAARQLRVRGANVHAITRNLDSAAAQELQSLGVKMWTGHYDDTELMKKAMAGCSGIFLNLMANLTDFDDEVRQARSVLAIAHEAGITHVVYTTGAGVNTPEKLDRDPDSFMAKVYGAKQAVEDVVRKAGFEHYTLIRPSHFMTNYLAPQIAMFPKLVDGGIYETALRKDDLLGCSDNWSIGNFAAAAFLDPVKFHAKEITFADEFLTTEQILKKVSAVTGREIKTVHLSDDEIQKRRVSDPVLQGQLFNKSGPILVDMEEVKSWGVPLSSWDVFLQREKRNILAAFKQAA
ncbi:NmrA-like family domain-containing oxidoreductase himF [Paramyrothecium foliicola]|nr:NmrA-like family domain-containing oxidoreductase himF [Paramyrothecium foliicola]